MLYYAIHRPMQRIVGQCRTINNWARQLRSVTANFNKITQLHFVQIQKQKLNKNNQICFVSKQTG